MRKAGTSFRDSGSCCRRADGGAQWEADMSPWRGHLRDRAPRVLCATLLINSYVLIWAPGSIVHAAPSAAHCMSSGTKNIENTLFSIIMKWCNKDLTSIGHHLSKMVSEHDIIQEDDNGLCIAQPAAATIMASIIVYFTILGALELYSVSASDLASHVLLLYHVLLCFCLWEN